VDLMETNRCDRVVNPAFTEARRERALMEGSRAPMETKGDLMETNRGDRVVNPALTEASRHQALMAGSRAPMETKGGLMETNRCDRVVNLAIMETNRDRGAAVLVETMLQLGLEALNTELMDSSVTDVGTVLDKTVLTASGDL